MANITLSKSLGNGVNMTIKDIKPLEVQSYIDLLKQHSTTDKRKANVDKKSLETSQASEKMYNYATRVLKMDIPRDINWIKLKNLIAIKKKELGITNKGD